MDIVISQIEEFTRTWVPVGVKEAINPFLRDLGSAVARFYR